MRTVRLHRGKRVVGISLSCGEVAGLEYLLVGGTPTAHPRVGKLIGNLLGACLACTDRQLEFHRNTTRVLLREEARTDQSEDGRKHRHQEEDCDGSHHRLAMTYGPVDSFCIPVVELVEEATHDEVVIPTAEPALALLQAKHLRAHHWGERQGRSGRNDHDDTHHPAQLLEEHTRHARHHGQWEEHADHGQGRSDNRDGHLVRTMDGCLLGLRTAFDVVGHVLEHHNGIIHHVADGYRKTRQRNHIDRRAHHSQVDERSHQRKRDGEHDHDYCAPASKEEEAHQCHEEHSVDDDLLQRTDGSVDVLRGVHNHTQRDVRRQCLLDLWQHGEHLLRDSHRVGTRLLLHDDHRALFARIAAWVAFVGEEGGYLLGTLLQAVFQLSHVAQIDELVALVADHEVEHLLRVVKLALHTQRVGIVARVERTARHVHVLGADHSSNAVDGQSVGLQLVRVAIDIDGTLGSTRHRHRTYAGNTCQRVGYLVVENLVERRGTFLRLGTQHQDRDHVGRELEDDRRTCTVGQRRAHHVELVAHVVGQRVDVVAVLKLQGDDGIVLLRLRGDMLQVVHRVERILKRSGDIVLNILSTGARIGLHHHDHIGIDIWHQVDRQFAQGEETKDRNGDEHQRGHNRSSDRSFV